MNLFGGSGVEWSGGEGGEGRGGEGREGGRERTMNLLCH